jgi:hypothetical protein
MIDPKEPRMINNNFKVESTIIYIIIIEMAGFSYGSQKLADYK